jgi:DNA topoisomerase VI subunit B
VTIPKSRKKTVNEETLDLFMADVDSKLVAPAELPGTRRSGGGAFTSKKAVKKGEKAVAPAEVVSPEAVDEKGVTPRARSPRNGGLARLKGGKTPRKGSAESQAKKQREISISEFFTKNRHLLGFDNPSKALLTTIKEAVDNSLDACEEAGVLPTLRVEAHQIAENRFRVMVQDNGPGIVKDQIPKIFGKLLYGSKFHNLKQSRGQQGIGISAAGMYGQLTTGKPVNIISRTGPRSQAHCYEVKINTSRNEPIVSRDEIVEWDVDHGTRVEIELEASYKRGRRSINDYLELTAVANPHLELTFVDPSGTEICYPRVTDEMPHEAKTIKPHPYGVELGILMAMLDRSKSRNLRSFLQEEFSRVGPGVADQILSNAMLRPSARPRSLGRDQSEQLMKGIAETKIMNPPTNCLSPIGAEELEAGLRKVVEAEFFTAISRKPVVYRGNPFLVEAVLAWNVAGHNADELATVHRFANRVPLQYQQGACAITKSVMGTAWKNYGLSQSRGALPTGSMVAIVHIASVWVPFTSESKEAVASYPEVLKEIRLALQDCGRRLGVHIRRGKRLADARKKQDYIKSYIPYIGEALREILELTEEREQDIISTLTDTLERSRKL